MSAAPEPVHVLELAEIHVRRYANQAQHARAGHRGYRLEECEHLLAIWRSIQAKGGAWSALSQDERHEVEDAIEDEA